MITVSITLDENIKYSIDLKNEYKADEFINTFDGHIQKIRSLISLSAPKENAVVSKVQGDAFADANELFKKLSALIDTLGTDICREDHDFMRSFKFNRKLRAKGFAWLAPKGPSLVVYLRKGDHSSVDPENKIVKNSTFGGYPMIYIKKPSEVDYAFNIIKKIYNNP